MKSISRHRHIWTFIFLCALIIFNAYYDSKLISSGVWINHFQHTLIGFAIALAIIFFFYRKPLSVILWLLFYFSFRWLLFDLALNYFRGLPLDYIGITDKHDAFSDIFLQENPHLQYVFKLVILAVSILLLFFHLRKSTSKEK